jgi:hypothetical protein
VGGSQLFRELSCGLALGSKSKLRMKRRAECAEPTRVAVNFGFASKRLRVGHTESGANMTVAAMFICSALWGDQEPF